MMHDRESLIAALSSNMTVVSPPFHPVQISGIKKPAYAGFLLHQTSVVEGWCPRPDSNWHALWAGDFKSPVSTDFTTRALPMEAEVGIEPAYTELQSAA